MSGNQKQAEAQKCYQLIVEFHYDNGDRAVLRRPARYLAQQLKLTIITWFCFR